MIATKMQDHWTAENIPDQTGKAIIITGANSGIGFEAAKELARKGAQVVLACRDLGKAQAALDTIRSENPQAKAENMQLDLASLDSVRQFAEAYQAKFNRLDVLLNNAGIMMVPYATTQDGFERQIGTNHLGHFALTGRLINLLRETPGARVVNISSIAHRYGWINFNNLMYENGKGYWPLWAYCRSKLANMLFTQELQRRFEAKGIDAIALAAHPGTADTNLVAHMQDRWLFRLLSPLTPWFVQSAAVGVLSILRAAVDPFARGGQFFRPDGILGFKGCPVQVRASRSSYNKSTARRLWEVSEELTGVRYLS